MIARIWHGAVPNEKADEYYNYMLSTGFSDYKKTSGFLDLKVLRSSQDGLAHFHILTFWTDYEAIRRFAGPDYEKPQYYPEDAQYLVELEDHVKHYEVTSPF